MARLAQYLTQLSLLYGNNENVHFEKVKKGSALLQVAVEEVAFPKVFKRLQSVKTLARDVDQDVTKAYKALDALLRNDNAVGSISRSKGGKILDFPGRKMPSPECYSVVQPTSVDGVIIKIGGKDDTIPVALRDQEGKLFNCQVRGQTFAKELSAYYLGHQLRVHGDAKWTRSADGVWEMEILNIASYEEIDSEPLDKVFEELKNIPNNGWTKLDDPLKEWKKNRGIE